MSLVPHRPIGLLGGTFDPVHNGHLRLAVELAATLNLAEVRLLPSARPPHRDKPVASPGQRAKWLRVAIAKHPRLRLDDRELLREGPSYTVDTLASIRDQLPNTPLCLIMGRDVYAELPDWHEWQRVFDLAHVILINRPDIDPELPAAASAEIQARANDDPEVLRNSLCGSIHVCEPPPLAISASRIRALLADGASPRYLLPDVVLDDILDAGVYREAAASA